jgi:hypothetical protein
MFFDLESTYRMYRKRAFNLVTVSTDGPDSSAAVQGILKEEYASSPNKQFATADRAGLQAAWGEKWNPSAPLTMVIAPGGEILYRKEGPFDILEVRRIIRRTRAESRSSTCVPIARTCSRAAACEKTIPSCSSRSPGCWRARMRAGSWSAWHPR